MLIEKALLEIKEYEEAGIDVFAIDHDRSLAYSSQGMGGCEYCDQCSSFRLLPDPNPFDWFRDDDMKAVCLEVNGVIASFLEGPSEYTNILNCTTFLLI